MNKIVIIVALVLLAVALLALGVALGMNRASSPPDSAATLEVFYTAQAQTLQAALTPVTVTTTPFLLTPPTPGGTGETVVPTSGPTSGPPPTLIYPPTFTPPPTLIPTPTFTPLPTLNACDRAKFIKDVTVPDGTHFPPGASFTKTWRLQNAGSCTWTTAYSLVFVSGDRMSGPTSQALTSTVAPGQTIDVSVKLVAPSTPGSYAGSWMLRNSAGLIFGIGEAANAPFWVKITVDANMTSVYNFADSACSANWKSGGGGLPCPGTAGSSLGYVIIQSKPIREDGVTENETGILTVPQNVTDGFIQGRYPYMTIMNGDRFKSIVNCEYNYKSCNVVFQLQYQIEGQDKRTLWSFNEAYEGEFYSADIDLSSLAGKDVRFFLVVLAHGSPNQDHALWIAPRIVRFSNLVKTPTATPKATKTPTATFTPTTTGTATRTSTPTSVATATPTRTSTPTSVATATPTPTSTPTSVATATPTPTSTPTATQAATQTPTETPTP
jgi:hypothetical protein